MGEETFHPDTRALLAYGRALAGSGAAPKKGGADQVLERLFVIERMKDGRWPVRTFESTVPPGKLGWGWARFAFGGWKARSWVDANIWRLVAPKGWFYNVMITGVKPS